MNKKKRALIAGLIMLVTALHYFTSPANAPLHEFYRELYFIPAILAGLWGGKKTGLTTSIVITLLFLPHVLHSMGTTFGAILINVIEMALFNIAGLFSGLYRDAKQGYISAANAPYHPSEIRKKFLLFVDGTPASLYAADYFANVFGKIPDIGVTLFGVFASGQEIDFFESPEKASGYVKERYQKEEEILKRAGQILQRGGIPESNIQMKISKTDKKSRISDKIIEEVRNEHYDTVVMVKRPKTKSQEFIFGSTTIALVRDARINVIAVKVPEEVEKNVSPGNSVDKTNPVDILRSQNIQKSFLFL